MSSGAIEVHLLAIFRAYLGNQSTVWVQNTGTSPANITLMYTPYSVGNPHVVIDTIPVGAVGIYDQAQMPELGASFNGGVLVQTNSPIAVVVKLSNATNISHGGAYIGIPKYCGQLCLPVPTQEQCWADDWRAVREPG